MKKPPKCESPLRSADGSSVRTDAEKRAAIAKHLGKVFLFTANLTKTSKNIYGYDEGSFSYQVTQVTQIFKERMNSKKLQDVISSWEKC